MSNIKKIGASSALITLALILSKIMGFAREFLIATQFGANIESDIYKAATRMPYLFLSCVIAALATTFIPIFSEVKNDREKANKFFNNIINITLILAIFFALAGIIFSDKLALIAGGFDANGIERTSQMTKIVMPSIIFLSINGLFQGYLQSYGKFLQPALTDVAASIIIILAIIAFSRYGIIAPIIAFVIGSMAQLAVQRPFMKDYKYKFYIDLKDKNIRKMLILAFPIIISTAAYQINVTVDTYYASNLAPGSISIVDYASKLSTIINQVFIVSITTVFYPMLTEKFASKDMEGFEKLIKKSISVVIIVAIPFIFGMIVLSTPLVKLLLEHGKFNSQDTEITALCLRYLAMGALGYSLMDILGKVFFTVKDTVTPMINGFITIALNIFLIVVLVPKLGVKGLTIAYTTSASVVAVILFVELKFKLKHISFRENIMTLLKALISGAVMGAIVYVAYFKGVIFIIPSNSVVFLVIKILLATIVGAVTYVIMLKILKVKEVNDIIDLKFKKLKFNKK